MGRGWYRRRHVDRDVCGHPGANPGGRFTLHILRGRCTARPSSRMRRQPYVARPSATVPSFASSARFKNVIFARRIIPGGSGKYGR
jgi:hypothetical protein